MYLSSSLLLGSLAAGQSARSVNDIPLKVKPPQTTTTPLAQAKAVSFGSPRITHSDGVTRLTFDLPAGMTYTMVPTFGGLRLDIGGVRVTPASALRLAENLTEYRAGNGQILMGTPFPLSLSDGWRVTEGGTSSNRTLTVELGALLHGGAESISNPSARVLAVARTTPAAQANLQEAVPATDVSARSVSTSDLPPGDSVKHTPSTLHPAPAALTETDTSRPSTLVGRIPGNAPANATVAAPRIGKNPGITRMVVDLPPGTGYRIVPTQLGLRVELLGVSVNSSRLSQQSISNEVRSWRYESSDEGTNLTILTGAPSTSRSAWRSQVLPPVEGDTRSRLVLDISPALANLTPMTAREKQLGTVPAMRVSSGLATLGVPYTTRPRVVIDPGHGGKDPGAVGAIVEKNVTLDVAKRVRNLLTDMGFEVIMTRETDRELHPVKDVDLKMRAQSATPGTQMFVSIHVNATEANAALTGYGIETWWNPNHNLSYDLATTLQRDMVKTTGAFDRGVKSYRSLSVLRNSKIPAALVEVGFTSHPVDGLNLTNNNYLERVAVGIATGIRDALMTGKSASGKPPAMATGK